MGEGALSYASLTLKIGSVRALRLLVDSEQGEALYKALRAAQDTIAPNDRDLCELLIAAIHHEIGGHGNAKNTTTHND